MSLITIDRSLLASGCDSADASVVEHSDCSSKSSQSEDFLMCKATAVGLNVRSRRRSSCIKPNDEIQDHLKKILELLRFGDYVQLVVRLQSEHPRPHHHRYCCVISTTGKLGTEESAVLGIDIANRQATVGLVLPIWQDMLVKLYGDGGFELITKDTVKQFKPVSVQALWAAFQAVNRACQVARINDYYSRGLTHDWVSHYHSLPSSDTYQIQEWLKTDDIDEFNRYTPCNPSLTNNATKEEKERIRMEALLQRKLEEIMYIVDLEEVTVLQLRQRMENELGISLHDYRHFIEKEVLTIFGRMDEASVIFDHLLLGTTFNASNRAELERRSVTHILNVTREVDNFFPNDKYEYKNVRVFDDEQSSLLGYFEEIHRFINEAKSQGTACLVHCKMGISRSATAVIAYTMKEQNWNLDTALAYVKSRRPCIQPNPSFMRELRTYQGILEASSNRHKLIFCKECPLTLGASQTAPTRPDPVSVTTADCPRCSSKPCTCTTTQSSPTSTPTMSPSKVKPVDLNAELFLFKSNCATTDTLPVLDQTSSPPVAEITKTIEIDRSQLQANNVGSGGPSDSQSDPAGSFPLVLARDSYCLRQWHPSLAEKVNVDDASLFVRKATKSPPMIRFAKVDSYQPCSSEQIDGLTCLSSSDASELSVDMVRVILCPEPKPLHTAVIREPLLVYTGIEKESKDEEELDESQQQQQDHPMQVICSSPDPKCDTSDMASVDTSVSVCTSRFTWSSSPSYHSFGVAQSQPDSARQTSCPTYSACSSGSCAEIEAETPRKYSSSVPSVSTLISSIGKHKVSWKPFNLKNSDAAYNVLDAESYWKKRRDLVLTSDGSSDIRPTSVHSAKAQQLSYTTDTAKSMPTSHCVKSRLRPDDSWIVFPRTACPEKSDVVMIERVPTAADTSYISCPTSDMRKQSSTTGVVTTSGFNRLELSTHSNRQYAEAVQTYRRIVPSRIWVPPRRSYPLYTSTGGHPSEADDHSSVARDLIIAQR